MLKNFMLSILSKLFLLFKAVDHKLTPDLNTIMQRTKRGSIIAHYVGLYKAKKRAKQALIEHNKELNEYKWLYALEMRINISDMNALVVLNYVLYENKLGKRKYECYSSYVAGSGFDHLKKSNRVYIYAVLPWLHHTININEVKNIQAKLCEASNK